MASVTIRRTRSADDAVSTALFFGAESGILGELGRIGYENDGRTRSSRWKRDCVFRINKADRLLIIFRLDIQGSAPSTSRRAPAVTAAILLLRSESVRVSLFSYTSGAGRQGYPAFIETASSRAFTDNWSEKAKRRKTTGTGRMKHLRLVHRRFLNGFRTGVPKGSRGPVTA